ncbi:hypothetical protein AAG570_003952, partial [Ranatra chinensis]
NVFGEAYTDTGLYNVICVDWSRVANKSYPVARWDMPKVGGEVASFLDKLAEAGIEPGKTHVVAHSLGAHVAGTAGLGVRTKIARITGRHRTHFKQVPQGSILSPLLYSVYTTDIPQHPATLLASFAAIL